VGSISGDAAAVDAAIADIRQKAPLVPLSVLDMTPGG
jgi:hypothetical protein